MAAHHLDELDDGLGGVAAARRFRPDMVFLDLAMPGLTAGTADVAIAYCPERVLPGYAPFCRLHVHRNWTSTRCLAVPVTDANRHLLRSDYEARTKDELPVLVRWFEGLEPPVANYLVPILYDREQLAKEGTRTDADWGVVGCLYTMAPDEIPMVPITMMRNALGVEEGGSGVPLDREAYQRSVEFWRTHANWRG